MSEKIKKLIKKGLKEMVKKIKLSLIIPDYENLRESKKDKKYVCKCEICEKDFKCSLKDAEVCRKCAFKYFL